MEGSGEDWGSPHWRRGNRDSGRGGGYHSGRSGRRENYNRSQQQYGDRQQQGQFPEDRTSYNRGEHQGRQYGGYNQQRENFHSHHADQHHQGYPRLGQREQHPHAGFRGPPASARFDAGEPRPTGYMHYGQEPMMTHMPEFWGGGGPPYHHHPVPPQGVPGPYAGLAVAGPRDPGQFPLHQPYLQHPMAAAQQAPGLGMGAGGVVGVAAAPAMAGPMFPPHAMRHPPQQAGAWAAAGPPHRGRDPARPAPSGGPGHNRGVNGGVAGSSSGGGGAAGPSNAGGGANAARKGSRAPPVPQPLAPSAASYGESTNSGMNSLGRPRQQPASSVNNVQPARAPAGEAPPVSASANGAGAEAGTRDLSPSSDPASTVAAAGAPSDRAGAPSPAHADHGATEASQSPASTEPQTVPPAGSHVPDGPCAGALPEAGSAAGDLTSSAVSSNSSHNEENISSIAVPVEVSTALEPADAGPCAAMHDAAESPDGLVASSSRQGPDTQHATAASGSPPTGKAPAEKPPAAAGGSVWKQGPATALFATGSAAAPSHGPIRRANAPTANAGASATSSGGAPPPPTAAAGVQPRVQPKPSPVQLTGPPHPRHPPPGFGTVPAAGVPSPGGTVPTGPASGPSVPLRKPDRVQQHPPQHSVHPVQQSLQPRASAGSESLDPTGSAQQPQSQSQSQSLHVSPAASVVLASPASPSTADVAEAQKARNWASVLASSRSSGGASAKPLQRRQASEGGGHDASAAAAAATLVNLRHASHQPLAAPLAAAPAAAAAVPAAVPAAAAGSPAHDHAAGHANVAHAPAAAAEVANAPPASKAEAPQKPASGELHASADAPEASVQAADPFPKAVPAAPLTGPDAAVVTAASAGLAAAPRNATAIAEPTAAATATGPSQREAPSPAPDGGVAPVAPSHTDGNATATEMAAEATPVPAPEGNFPADHRPTSLPEISGQVAAAAAVVAEPQPPAATAATSGETVVVDAAQAALTPPTPAAGASTDPAAAASSEAQPAAVDSQAPTAPAPARSWAAALASQFVASRGTGSSSGHAGPRTVQAVSHIGSSATWGRVQGRGRGGRTAFSFSRVQSAQPPEGMFHNLTGALSTQPAAAGPGATGSTESANSIPSLKPASPPTSGVAGVAPSATAASAHAGSAAVLTGASSTTPPPAASIAAAAPILPDGRPTAESGRASSTSSFDVSVLGKDEDAADHWADDPSWQHVQTKHKSKVPANAARTPLVPGEQQSWAAYLAGAGRGPGGRHGEGAAAGRGRIVARGPAGQRCQPQPAAGAKSPAVLQAAAGPAVGALADALGKGSGTAAWTSPAPVTQRGVPPASAVGTASPAAEPEASTATEPTATEPTATEPTATAASAAPAEPQPEASATPVEAVEPKAALAAEGPTERGPQPEGPPQPREAAATAETGPGGGADAELAGADVASQPPATSAPSAEATEQPKEAQQVDQPSKPQAQAQPEQLPGAGDKQDKKKKSKKKDGSAATAHEPAAVPPAIQPAVESKPEPEDEPEAGAAGTIPAGNNPWDLLEGAGDDGQVARSGTGSGSAPGAEDASRNAPAASVRADLMQELRQLLTAGEVPGAGTRQLQTQLGGQRLQPRGLVNTGNTCFINATMQALLACGPFAAILSRLPAMAPLLESSKSPTLYGMALFVAEMTAPQSAAGGGTGTAVPGGAAAREEPPVAEEEGWAEVPAGRGKKGGQRKSTSAYPTLHQAAAAGAAAATASSSAASATASAAVVLGGKPLVPSMLNGIVAAFNPRISITATTATVGGVGKPSMAQMLSKGSSAVSEQQEQQDAQEFFQFLYNKLHEEVVALRKAHGLAAPSGDATAGTDIGDGDEWSQVGRKNKATVTRQVGTPSDDAASRSPVSSIFSGQLKSTVRITQSNYKASATIEAFNMLHLDIAANEVHTLEDALRQHSQSDNIDGHTPCDTT